MHENLSNACRSISFGSKKLCFAATRNATAVTSMCMAVKNVTYWNPNVEIKYLFAITMETDDTTDNVNAPITDTSLPPPDTADALFDDSIVIEPPLNCP